MAAMVEGAKRFGGLGWYQKIEAVSGEQVLKYGGCAHGYRFPWLFTGELYLTNRRLIWTTIRPLGTIVELTPEQVTKVEPIDRRFLYLSWRKAWVVETCGKTHLFSMDWWGFWGGRDTWIEAIRKWANT